MCNKHMLIKNLLCLRIIIIIKWDEEIKKKKGVKKEGLMQ